MQLEKLKNVNHKKVIIGGLIVVGVLSAIILTTTRAKYRTTQSINIAKGTVNYSVPDLRVVAVYLESDDGGYIISNDVPTSGYTLNTEKSVCKVATSTSGIENAPVDDTITIEYNNGAINFLGLSKNNTRCYLYFDKEKDTTAPTISNVAVSNITTTSFRITVTANDDKGVTEYYYSKDNGTTYTKATTNTYTFSGLSAGTKYNVKVYVKDEAGNESTITSKSVTTTTASKSTLDKLGLTATEGATSFTGPSTTNEGIKIGTDDDGTTYYYRGAVTNNWVKFAGFYWRIIRINGDGSIRMIYNGTSTATTGVGTQIVTSAYNSSYNDNAYVGYMYGTPGSSTYAETHANTNSSTIKTVLDNWYNTNLNKTGIKEHIDTNAGFCNDRKISTTTRSEYGTLGYGTNATAYAPTDRTHNSSWSYLSTQTPTFKCNQANDLFTPTSSNKGNKKLQYPVGLITMDEVIFAGGFGGTANRSYYLYTYQFYWTMSPYVMGTDSNGRANMFNVYSNGNPSGYSGNATTGVRPVINLKADTVFATGGNGTSSNPYVVE